MFNRTLLILSVICLISCTKEIIQQKLTVSVTPANGGSVSPPSNSYEKGSNVSLVATPTGEYLFKQWQGSISGTSNPTSITMDADKSVTGVFEKRQYPLTLTIEGSGTVKEEVIGIATQALYPSGTTVRLTAVPIEGWSFSGWSGDQSIKSNPLDIKVDKAISLKATFEKLQYSLNLTIEGNGTVKEEIIAVNTQSQYPSGTTVKLTANPGIGWRFDTWSGDETDNKNPLTILIAKNTSINAIFKPIPFDYLKPSFELRNNTKWLDYYEIPKQNQVDVLSPAGKSYIGGVAMADFNTDGYLDVVMAPGINRNTLIPLELYLYNPSNGNYVLNSTSITGNVGTNSIIKSLVGDFNGDKIPDVFFADTGSEYGPMPSTGWPGEYLSIMLSESKGKFRFSILNQFPKNFYHGACSGDFDRDGDLDIFLPADCSFLLNDGKANFTRSMNVFINPVNAIIACEMVDIDQDGFLDLIVGGQNTYANLKGFIDANRIYWGNGKNFDLERSLALPEIAGWDLTLDFGFIDLNKDSQKELILLRTGDSSGNGSRFYMGYYLQILAVNKLGFQDVTSIYLNDNYNISGRNIPNILVGDINQNGLIDIVNPDKGTSYGSPNNKNPSIIWEMGADQKFIKK